MDSGLLIGGMNSSAALYDRRLFRASVDNRRLEESFKEVWDHPPRAESCVCHEGNTLLYDTLLAGMGKKHERIGSQKQSIQATITVNLDKV